MAKLVIVNGQDKGDEHVLVTEQTIGRLQSNSIPVRDTRMSRRNTRVYSVGTGFRVEDMKSKNGTFLNDERITVPKDLDEGDEIRVGETIFVFLAEEESGTPAAAAPEVDVPRVSQGPGQIEIRSTTAPTHPADLIQPKSDKALQYSKHATGSQTQTSLAFLRQDLGQRDGGFRLLVFFGVLLIAVGLFWLVMTLVAGS